MAGKYENGVFVNDPNAVSYVAPERVELVCDGASGDQALECEIAKEMVRLFALFKQRQKKYGPGNISAFGDMGVCVRASDKLARLRHAYFSGGDAAASDESMDDSWSDLSVYGTIALVARRGVWPGYSK